MRVGRRLVILGASISLSCLLVATYYGIARQSRVAVADYIAPLPDGLLSEVPAAFRSAVTAFILLNPPSALAGLVVDRALVPHFAQGTRVAVLCGVCVGTSAAVWWWLLIAATRTAKGRGTRKVPGIHDERAPGT